MEDELRVALKRVGAKKTFRSFAEAILDNYDVLKSHYVFQYHDDCYGDVFDFDFRKQLEGPLKTKFDLLSHIFGLDECDELEGLLKELGWENMPPDCGLDTEGMIHEALYGHGDRSGNHDLERFAHFEKQEWENFVNYF